MTAQTTTAQTSTPAPPQDDARRAEQAWCGGDPFTAMELADRALAAGTDPDGHAAGVAAAASAADGAMRDGARRWRGVAAGSAGAAAAAAGARAALAEVLTGGMDAAERDLACARELAPDPAPRALAVLLEGVGAVRDAIGGDLDGAARALTGLAAVTVPPDLLAAERWDELASCVAAAGGDDATARAMLDRDSATSTTRRTLLATWSDLRAGHVAAARAGLAGVGDAPVLRRDAVLAAAVSAGLARRSGGAAPLASTWRRSAPVVAGADVEILLLDVWGELSVAAQLVDPADDAALAAAMADAVTRAGSPWWAVAADRWWQVERAAVAGDAEAAGDAARTLHALAPGHARLQPLADAAAVWAAVLRSSVHPPDVARAARGLADCGRGFEATQLCAAAAARTADPAAARALLGAVRKLRRRPATSGSAPADALSPREREVGALVVDGLTHKEIGSRLYISPKTVEQHVARLRQKLAASSRASLVAALRERL